jgi:hypothetical protein
VRLAPQPDRARVYVAAIRRLRAVNAARPTARRATWHRRAGSVCLAPLQALILDEDGYWLSSFVDHRRHFVSCLELADDASASRHGEIVLNLELPGLADGEPDVGALKVARQRDEDAVVLDDPRARGRRERNHHALERSDDLLKGSCCHLDHLP